METATKTSCTKRMLLHCGHVWDSPPDMLVALQFHPLEPVGSSLMYGHQSSSNACTDRYHYFLGTLEVAQRVWVLAYLQNIALHAQCVNRIPKSKVHKVLQTTMCHNQRSTEWVLTLLVVSFDKQKPSSSRSVHTVCV